MAPHLFVRCRLAPNESLESGVYAGTCLVCKAKLKFRVTAGGGTASQPLPEMSKLSVSEHGCCSRDKGCGKKACAPAASVASPDPVTSITFTLNGAPVCRIICEMRHFVS